MNPGALRALGLEARLGELGGDAAALGRELVATGWHAKNVERVLGVRAEDLADGTPGGTSRPEGAERTSKSAPRSPDAPAADRDTIGPRAPALPANAPAPRPGGGGFAAAGAPPRESSRGRLLGPIRKPEPVDDVDFDDDEDLDEDDGVRADVVDLEERRRALRNEAGIDASRDQSRSRRTWATRAKTEALSRFSKRHLRLLGEGVEHDGQRPATRGDCAEGPRPCPYVSCRFHLLLDAMPNGHLKINFPQIFNSDDEPDLELMVETCALDVADRTGATLMEVADLMNVTRERVRQIEEKAIQKVRVGRGRFDPAVKALAEHS